jgi:prepilin-type N-terminal cleavage/methylation domain-containing protein
MKVSHFLGGGRARNRQSGFTLFEMMTVIVIIALLSVLSGPAIQAISQAGTVNRASSDLATTFEMARTYAMAHRTYVRVAFAQMPVSATRALPETVVLSIYSVDGTLDRSAATDMQKVATWPALDAPLVINGLVVLPALVESSPDTPPDDDPSNPPTPSAASPAIAAFTRQTGAITPTPNYVYCVQFNPNGEAGITTITPSRHIRLGLDQPVSTANPTVARDKNPFIIRLSGINGSITVLRKNQGVN